MTVLARVIGAALIALGIVVGLTSAANATWKPEYSKSPEAVRQWFENATVAGWPELQACIKQRMGQGQEYEKSKVWCARQFSPAYIRLGVAMCCKQAERLKTKFVPTREGDWLYYPDPNCTSAGCPLLPIKPDVVHTDRIRADNLKDDALPEFDAMRREGVLFIYNGEPSCFWPPESGI